MTELAFHDSQWYLADASKRIALGLGTPYTLQDNGHSQFLGVDVTVPNIPNTFTNAPINEKFLRQVSIQYEHLTNNT